MTHDPFILLPEHLRPVFRDNPERFAVLRPVERTVLVRPPRNEEQRNVHVPIFWRNWPFRGWFDGVLLVILDQNRSGRTPAAEYWTPCHDLAEALICHMLELASVAALKASMLTQTPPAPPKPDNAFFTGRGLTDTVVMIDGAEYVRLPSKEALLEAWLGARNRGGDLDAVIGRLDHWLKTREPL